MNRLKNSIIWKLLSPTGRYIKRQIRKFEMIFEEIVIIISSQLNASRGIEIFNLDLHIGVIADLESELTSQGMRLKRWSISGSNGLIRKFLTHPDPVAYVNKSSWTGIDNQTIQKKFKKRYSKFFNAFDGFVFTYSPTLAQLFGEVGKPILIVAATRYETPFTNKPKQWDDFNHWLINSTLSGQVILAANNKGDADYLEYYTGIKPRLVPSLCEKEGEKWRGGNGKRVIIGRVPQLVDAVVQQTNGYFEPISSLGTPYSWQDLLQCEEVLVLPQNISTMTMFELTTAGVPVCVPNKTWMKLLKSEYPQLLEELSFAQQENIDSGTFEEDNPNNWKSEQFLDWWLDRADFYDHELMPNVTAISSFNDLCLQRTITDKSQYLSKIESRNIRIQAIRRELIDNFKSICITKSHI